MDDKELRSEDDDQVVATGGEGQSPEKLAAGEKTDKGEGRKKGLHREIERLKEQQAQWQTELEAQRDRYLRLAAELDNYRKRNERDFHTRVQMSLAEFYLELLPIVDDLERSLVTLRGGASDKKSNHGSLADGVELILQNFRKVLENRGVKAMESAVGMRFDPTMHEALTQIESPPAAGQKPSTVLEEHVKGYMLFDRILRPAKVIISK